MITEKAFVVIAPDHFAPFIDANEAGRAYLQLRSKLAEQNKLAVQQNEESIPMEFSFSPRTKELSIAVASVAEKSARNRVQTALSEVCLDAVR